MPKNSLIFGFLLIALGLVAYFGSSISSQQETAAKTEVQEQESASAESGKKRSAITGLIIPAAFGVLLVACGLVGMRESARKHAMHAAAMVGLLGAVATFGKGGYDLFKLMNGQDVNPRAMTFVFLMAILCSVFVGLCVKSFIDARKKREAEQTGDEAADVE